MGILLGRITESEGFVPSGKHKLEFEAVHSLHAKPVCREYGVSFPVTHVLKPYMEQLKTHFPRHCVSFPYSVTG